MLINEINKSSICFVTIRYEKMINQITSKQNESHQNKTIKTIKK